MVNWLFNFLKKKEGTTELIEPRSEYENEWRRNKEAANNLREAVINLNRALYTCRKLRLHPVFCNKLSANSGDFTYISGRICSITVKSIEKTTREEY